MKNLTDNNDELLNTQQELIRRLVNFTENTMEAMQEISDTLEVIQENIVGLRTAQNMIKETVNEFLEVNDMDVRPTSGGTG